MGVSGRQPEEAYQAEEEEDAALAGSGGQRESVLHLCESRGCGGL
jgi:hypothetical protein